MAVSMWTEDKIKNNILNNNYIKIQKRIYNYEFIINRKPENYVRERSGRGNHFYNPKQKIINEYREIMQEQLNQEEKSEINAYLKNDIYIKLNCQFYVPIPKGDSLQIATLKEMKEILPNRRPDEDNYEKLLLDALHNVIYDDDAKVVSINSGKFYSINPRTEIQIEVIELLGG